MPTPASGIDVEQVDTAMAEAAIRDVGRHVVAAAYRAHRPQRADYPGLSRATWAAVLREADRIANYLDKPVEYADAYEYLTRKDGAR